jgi:hypothetical protein
MPYIWISSYSGPPSTITVCDFATETICYTSPTQITNIGPFPYIINLPSPDFDSVYKISLSAQSDNGCLIVETDTCSTLPTPTPSPLPDCSYILFDTNDNFVTSGTVDYLDCYGVQQTENVTTTGLFGLCVISASTSVEIDIVDDSSYDCTYFEGIWYPPNIPTPTQTPTNPPTPTITPTVFGLIESMTFPYNFTQNSNVELRIHLSDNSIGHTINWGDGNVEPLIPGIDMTHTYAAGSGNLRISGLTETAGLLTYISSFNMEGPYYDSFSAIAKISGTTSELSKAVNTDALITYGTHISGDIAEFSGLSSMVSLQILAGNYYGDVNDLPNNIYRIILGSQFPSAMTVSGNIANIPASCNILDIGGGNTVTGDISGYTNGRTFNDPLTASLIVNGYNTISGLFQNLPDINNIEINTLPFFSNPPFWITVLSGNTISGNLQFKPNQSIIRIGGGNTISGNFSTTSAMTNFDTLEICGLNTISANLSGLTLPSSIFRVIGNNTISGTLNSILNVGTAGTNMIWITNIGNVQTGSIPVNASLLQYNVISSGTTISGDISSLSLNFNLGNIYFGGNNTVTGDIGTLTNTTILSNFTVLSNNNTINAASFTTSDPAIFFLLGPSFRWRFHTSASGMNTTNVNALLQYLAAKWSTYTIVPGGSKLFITGTGHGAPSGAGITARTALVNKGMTVTIT